MGFVLFCVVGQSIVQEFLVISITTEYWVPFSLAYKKRQNYFVNIILFNRIFYEVITLSWLGWANNDMRLLKCDDTFLR